MSCAHKEALEAVRKARIYEKVGFDSDLACDADILVYQALSTPCCCERVEKLESAKLEVGKMFDVAISDIKNEIDSRPDYPNLGKKGCLNRVRQLKIDALTALKGEPK